MINHKQPPNWVRERSKCTLDLKFTALREIVERDVAEFNKLNEQDRQGFSCSVKFDSEGTRPRFRVKRSDGEASTFELDHWAIRIWPPFGVKPPHLAFAVWDEKAATCRMRFNERSCRVWEISQSVLGPLFFEVREEA